MKKFLSFLLVAAMLMTCVSVFAVETDPETGNKKYSFDLSIEKSVSENNFRFAAISKADGKLVEAEATARGTWKEEYLGYWPIGSTGKADYVFYDTEDRYCGSIIDMVASGNYKSAVIFTAPETGVYDIYFEGVKYQGAEGALIDVTLAKNGSSQLLASAIGVTGAGFAGEVVFEVNSVSLSAGDEIMVVSTLNDAHSVNGCDNLGILKFDVTYVGAEGGFEYGNSTYSYGCDLAEKTCGNFYLAARKTADGTIDRLKDAVGTAWSATWKGWRPNDNSVYVFCETQVSNSKLGSSNPHGLKGEFAYIDMTPTATYDSVIAFVAPTSGTYSFDALFSKLNILAGRPSGYKVEAIKGEEVLASYTFATQSPSAKHENANLKANEVYLKTGETIMFVASHVSDNPHDNEIAVRYINVTLVEASCEHDWKNGVCENCLGFCAHEWADGVCAICKVACGHYWEDGACDYCGISCYHDWSYANGESTCGICGAVTDDVYVKYVSDIYTNKTVDGQFFLAAIRNEDGVVCAVETTPRKTFSADYPGNWIVGATTGGAYITQKTESKNPAVRFDMYSDEKDNYTPIIGFNVPADGVFDVSAKLVKVGGGTPTIVVKDNNGNKYFNFKITEYGQAVDIELNGIELSEGDMLYIAVETGEGQKNVGFISYEVGGLFATCPHVWDAENGTCTVCGVGCEHVGGKATCQKGAICDACGYEYTAVDANAHVSEEYVYVDLNNGSHEKRNACCNALVDTEACYAVGNYVCKYCEHFFEDQKLSDYWQGSLMNLFIDTDYAIDPVGPAIGALDSYKLVKPVDDLGVIYACFNLRLNDEGDLVLRHHFAIIASEYKIYANDVEVTLDQDEGYNTYYFETECEIGKLDEAVKITVEVGGESVTYYVSAYSYMAVALENAEDTDVINAINALYDYDVYVKAN